MWKKQEEWYNFNINNKISLKTHTLQNTNQNIISLILYTRMYVKYDKFKTILTQCFKAYYAL